MITSMRTEFFFGFLIGFVTGVLLCVGVMFLLKPSYFPEMRTPGKQAVHQRAG
jgi:hypothetical protein